MPTHQSELEWSQAFDKLAESHFVVIDGFLDQGLCNGMRSALHSFLRKDAFHLASIGPKEEQQVHTSIRSDRIYWIDRSDKDPVIHQFLDKVVSLMQVINRECFLSLGGYEFHFAHYPPGSFYKRHLDQFDRRNNRLISVICYLNPAWQHGDGGELVVHPSSGTVSIAPVEGRLVLMRSDILEHEVLPAVKDRYSITGWLCHKPPGLGFLDESHV